MLKGLPDLTGNQSRLPFVCIGKALEHIRDRFLRSDEDAVPLTLSMNGQLVSSLLEELFRHLVIGQFEFLQADDIGLCFIEVVRD